MRKYNRLFLRFFFAVTFLILVYLSKTTFEIKYLTSDSMNENDAKADEGLHDSNNGVIDFMKKNYQHDRKDSQHKPIKLPPFVSDSPSDGPGEHGKPEILVLSPDEEKEKDRLYALHYFNQYLSDRISVHRRLDDTRSQGCRDMTYPQNLPMVSVIICFYNEAWSVLLRSVHSILDRSPPMLLREIILVDDFSTMGDNGHKYGLTQEKHAAFPALERFGKIVLSRISSWKFWKERSFQIFQSWKDDHLKGTLDQYMESLQKVRIIRSSKREGLIRGRLLGYDVATGPVLVFLDSHIECFPGWLEPMVARIAEDPKAVAFPQIPIINKNTFSIANKNSTSVGSFMLASLTFTWVKVPLQEANRRTRDTDPIRSPTMPGGLFAIDKNWFTTLGTYDEQLDYWGGENIELSFKSWMCNGSVEVIPCSQVGHLYRFHNPIKSSLGGIIERNYMRVAEVWMDEYKDYLDYSNLKYDFGDVSDRKRLRDSLHCHDFKWYLDNVLEFTPPTIVARGEIRSESVPQCLDSMGDKQTPDLFPCHGTGFNQKWVFTHENYIMQGLHKKLCYRTYKLRINGCSDSNNIWWLNYEKGRIQHSESGLCLELRIPKTLTMAKCNGSDKQRWILPERITI